MEKIKTFFKWLRSCISPVYIMMLVAAFVLWFITKLGDEYTTDHEVTVVIEDVEYTVNCTIRGKGTDLIYYTLSSTRSRFTIPINDLTLDKPLVDNNGNSIVHITAESLKLALAQRMDNIEVVSVGSVPVIKSGPAVSENEKGDTHNVEEIESSRMKQAPTITTTKVEPTMCDTRMPMPEVSEVEQVDNSCVELPQPEVVAEPVVVEQSDEPQIVE